MFTAVVIPARTPFVPNRVCCQTGNPRKHPELSAALARNDHKLDAV
jgi:hypothetical protein